MKFLSSGEQFFVHACVCLWSAVVLLYVLPKTVRLLYTVNFWGDCKCVLLACKDCLQSTRSHMPFLWEKLVE